MHEAGIEVKRSSISGMLELSLFGVASCFWPAIMISQNCSGHIYGNYRYDCKAILIETKHCMLRVVNSVEQ